MRLLIYTTVSGPYYSGYVPFFLWCAKRAYPEAQVQVQEVAHPETQIFYAACYRLLTTLTDHDHYYITDVDMMLLKQSPTLVEYHKARMDEAGMCYSNSVRGKEYMGDKRLTGLHFCNDEWYEKTREVRKHYMDLLFKGDIGGGRFDDELTLMKVAQESSLPIASPKKLLSLHFGIHLGTMRNYWHHTRERMKTALRLRISTEQARQWQEIVQEPEYQTMKRGAQRRIQDELNVLEAFTARQAKV